MEITYEDAVLTPVAEDIPLFDLRFYKNVKKRDTGQVERELGSPLYGLTLYHALKRICSYKMNKKYQEKTIELKQYIKELRQEEEKLRKYLNEQLPEKFDTGE
jgi:hypothetical protein